MRAQGTHFVSVEPVSPATARRGAEFQAPVRFTIRAGYHINSDQPAEEYMIPTVLTWSSGPFTLKGVIYPKAEPVKYEFSSKPLLVWSGTITVTSRFQAPADAPPGTIKLSGKLRYQACNNNACFPPKNLDVSVPVTVE